MGAFGKFRKLWEKIKGVGKKVWGGIKHIGKAVMPIAKTVAPMVAGAVGGPGAAAAASAGLEVADQVVNNGDWGGVKAAVKKRGKGAASWLTS